jgi:hypothetical protein
MQRCRSGIVPSEGDRVCLSTADVLISTFTQPVRVDAEHGDTAASAARCIVPADARNEGRIVILLSGFPYEKIGRAHV